MARQSDSFLPSGAIMEDESTSTHSIPSHAIENLPRHIPGSVENSRPPPKVYSTSSAYRSAPHNLSQSRTLTKTQNYTPISPPTTRSPSTDDTVAALVDDWREYTNNLREQSQAERAHMAADRARMEEVMLEERALWDKERRYLRSQIKELESRLATFTASRLPRHGWADGTTSPPDAYNSRNGEQSVRAQTNRALPSSGSIEAATTDLVHQESGRNEDGSCFYAPVSQNVSRTFGTSQNGELRVDSISTPRDTVIRVPSKELTQSDFGVQTPPVGSGSHDGSVTGESIDISHIHQDLDGVPIKASAISPTFVAKVLSPNSTLSPSNRSPSVAILHPRDPCSDQEGPLVKMSTLEVMSAPENRRLTMNAGHTPTHSMTKFDLNDSGNATPTQSENNPNFMSSIIEPTGSTLQTDMAFDPDPDPELTGPLGLENDLPKDTLFLAVLTSKLEEVKDNATLSPTESSVADEELLKSALNILGRKSSQKNDLDDDDDEGAVEEVPKLRVRESSNFGRPFGCL